MLTSVTRLYQYFFPASEVCSPQQDASFVGSPTDEGGRLGAAPLFTEDNGLVGALGGNVGIFGGMTGCTGFIKGIDGGFVGGGYIILPTPYGMPGGGLKIGGTNEGGIEL